MANKNTPEKWKKDIIESVDLYNSWFMEFAPKAFRETRAIAALQAENALMVTECFTRITPEVLQDHPEVLPILRMSTSPPIARERLVGLSGAHKNIVDCMEDTDNPRVPPRMKKLRLETDLQKVCDTLIKMVDLDIFVWLNRKEKASDEEVRKAANIVADRLCSAITDPLIRNAQEKRQLSKIDKWLSSNGYSRMSENMKFNQMDPGTYSFRTIIPVTLGENSGTVKINVPVSVAIMPKSAQKGDIPLLIEAKSAGDFTNVNKRRKEVAQKVAQLRSTYGDKVRYGLFLCGYFDSRYLGYEAAEGIDWVWEHRISDLENYGL